MSLAVIMFELTDTLTYTVPVMLSILTAKTVADYLEPKGIYDLVIEYVQSPAVQIEPLNEPDMAVLFFIVCPSFRILTQNASTSGGTGSSPMW